MLYNKCHHCCRCRHFIMCRSSFITTQRLFDDESHSSAHLSLPQAAGFVAIQRMSVFLEFRQLPAGGVAEHRRVWGGRMVPSSQKIEKQQNGIYTGSGLMSTCEGGGLGPAGSGCSPALVLSIRLKDQCEIYSGLYDLIHNMCVLSESSMADVSSRTAT